MGLPDEAIARIRSLVRSGQLQPGSRLPAEQQLAAALGVSRNSMREAVKALEAARVLDVRRGDGTYVTSLTPHLLLEGLGQAIELLPDQHLPEVLEVRRMLEPAATGAAAMHIDEFALAELSATLRQMQDARDDDELWIQHDIAFHLGIIQANRNETLTSLLEGLFTRRTMARIRRGVPEAHAAEPALAEHHAIWDALAAHDAALAQATALVHINSDIGTRTT